MNDLRFALRQLVKNPASPLGRADVALGIGTDQHGLYAARTYEKLEMQSEPSPDNPLQPGDMTEMLIAADQRQIVLFGECSYPEVVVGNDLACGHQIRSELSVERSGSGIDRHQHHSGDKASDPFEVLYRTLGAVCAEVQFTQHDRWKIDRVARLKLRWTAGSPLKGALTMLVSNKTAVGLSVDPLKDLVDGLLEGVGFGGSHAACRLCQGALPLVAVGFVQPMNQLGHVLQLGGRQLFQLFHNHLDLAHTARNYPADQPKSRPVTFRLAHNARHPIPSTK